MHAPQKIDTIWISWHKLRARYKLRCIDVISHDPTIHLNSAWINEEPRLTRGGNSMNISAGVCLRCVFCIRCLRMVFISGYLACNSHNATVISMAKCWQKKDDDIFIKHSARPQRNAPKWMRMLCSSQLMLNPLTGSIFIVSLCH